jgi:hypothetical protein
VPNVRAAPYSSAVSSSPGSQARRQLAPRDLVHLAGSDDPAVTQALIDATGKVLARTRSPG